MYQELKLKTVLTRKNHQCSWCAETIKAGELAEYRVYVFEGDFNSDYMHHECNHAYREILESIREYITWIPGEHERGEKICTN